CHEQGQNQLSVLAKSVDSVTTWNQQHANGWLTIYDQIVRKYQVQPAEAVPTRNKILSHMFSLVGSQQVIADGDLEYLSAQGQRYHITQSESPELEDAVLGIALRQAIQSWDSGKPPKRECKALILGKDEVCCWEESAGLYLQRTKREYVGVYGSVRMGR